jgi:hypothetical protein
MPEEAEIDTDKLRETIDEEIERSGSTMLRWVSLSTALLAAIAAVAALTRQRLVWYASLALGATGLALFAIPLVSD